jgi:hypothetical protein
MAAVAAARADCSVILIVPDGHIGGTTTGGLGQTDMGGALSGMSRDFYQRVYRYYERPAAWVHETRDDYLNADGYDYWALEGRGWSRRWRDGAAFTFEPSAAAAVMHDLLAETAVAVILNERLDRAGGVVMADRRIVRIGMESGLVIRGRVFIDATYEGDLMAAAGVPYVVGREANSRYGETFNGVQTVRATKHQLPPGIDPYIIPGDPASGLLPGIDPDGPGAEGEGDHRVQAYNIRLTLTDVPANRVPFSRPDDYDERRYELLLRAYAAGYDQVPLHAARMPNRKTDVNNSGGFSTDYIGANYAYPEASHAERERIAAAHRSYIRGLLWTIAEHPRVPSAVRARVADWGFAADEFAGHGHLSPQVYVREARRMVSDYVMTEADVTGQRAAPDPVAVGGYQIDSHNTQRYVDAAGHVRNEGDLQTRAVPYGISYRALVPGAGAARNLLVPVCVSASHVAYGTIRMEPGFMQLGQVAGLAAALALEADGDCQALAYATLRARLEAAGLILP